MEDTPGNYMQKGKTMAIKALVSFFGVLVYVAGIIYAEVHGYALLSRGVDPDMILWATVGIIALGITALFLPLGLHYSFHAPLQRFAAFAFYAVDLGLLIFNAIADYTTRTAGVLPTWLDFYMLYAMPATPIIAACGWSLLTLLDPAQKERGMIEALKASTREALAFRIAEQAKAADVSQAVDQAAEQMARDIIAGTLGASVASTRRRLPSQTIDLQAEQPKEKPKRSHPLFIMPRARSNGVQSYNLEADQVNADPTQPGNGESR